MSTPRLQRATVGEEEGADCSPALTAVPQGDSWCVAFDVDDVLCNLRDLLAPLMARMTGKNIPWTDWYQLGVHSLYGVSAEQMLQWIIDERLLEHVQCEPGAASAVARIRDLGYRTAVVTARGFHPQGKEVTQAWLHAQGIRVDEVSVVPVFGGKSEAIRGLGRVAAYVDDHLVHVEDARVFAGVPRAVVMDRPWNRHGSQFGRISNLSEYADIVEREGPVVRRAVAPGRLRAVGGMGGVG